MTDDATLSEFVGETGETDGDDADATAIDSGLSTYAWGAYTCSRCDSDVERVWREDGSLVCPDCKSW
ncbi:hypothetical protein RBH26_11850 [Natronolimnohabitans sp. A-GB9]|uniref:DUF7573 domain-containing protein n=1 Tax=Natronolimnohabitans sp. A-GB9 TaxID=3069757 RepID=UPI0027B250FF|nr:hypothetical protein [Natronolimnohabitans sp. A-GB9]MDQ2051174.1 hypothetical protein [Natronolimnohabitans sp. A-GB9]